MPNNCNELSELQLSNGTCPTTAYQNATICVPVTISPYAKAGRTRTCCCGDPIVSCCKEPDPRCTSKSCCFTLTQTICVAVPVVFGADAIIGDYCVDFDETSKEDVNAIFEKDEIDQL
jgi:hypothetical protein